MKTSGCSALKGGIPTINSNNMTPTDHQSAVKPEKINMVKSTSVTKVNKGDISWSSNIKSQFHESQSMVMMKKIKEKQWIELKNSSTLGINLKKAFLLQIFQPLGTIKFFCKLHSRFFAQKTNSKNGVAAPSIISQQKHPVPL